MRARGGQGRVRPFLVEVREFFGWRAYINCMYARVFSMTGIGEKPTRDTIRLCLGDDLSLTSLMLLPSLYINIYIFILLYYSILAYKLFYSAVFFFLIFASIYYYLRAKQNIIHYNGWRPPLTWLTSQCWKSGFSRWGRALPYSGAPGKLPMTTTKSRTPKTTLHPHFHINIPISRMSVFEITPNLIYLTYTFWLIFFNHSSRNGHNFDKIKARQELFKKRRKLIVK